MRRREFFATPLAVAAGAGARASAAGLESPYLKLEYDLAAGRTSIHTAKGSPLLLNATAAVVFPSGERLASDPAYTRHSRLQARQAPGIEGRQLAVSLGDASRVLDLESRITLLSNRPGAIFELILTNVSGKELMVRRAEPLRALLDEDAGCYFNARQALTHGYMHHDPGGLMDLGRPHREFTSFWNVALHSPSATLVVGHLDNTDGEGQIAGGGQMTRGGPSAQIGISLVARSLYNRYFVLKPGASVSSGRVLLLLSADPFSALEYYAETCGRLHPVRFNPIINGWCSWFYTHLTATEEEQVKNAEFIAGHLKPYGMEWVQIDDGYQRAFGDWEANALYPHGMKWLATRIRELGLKPGIWIAPHVISEDTEIAKRHPEWLLHDAKGRIQNTGSSRPKSSFSLDVTHPGARQWLFELFRTIRREWGYDFIKLDFPGWTILAAERYFDPSFSKAQAYRLFLKTVREAAGPDCHILDCGPGSAGVGLIDSMRVEQDSGLLNWHHYAKRFNSNAPSMAIRYYFHKRTWINDADHLGLALMSVPQAQAAASIIALSGGAMISGDRLFQLDPARLEILKKVLPAYGEAARPLDLFEKSYPETFALRVRRDFEEWRVIGYFNWDEGAQVTRELDLARAGLAPEKTYLAYDFWSQRLIGEAGGKLVLSLGPSSVRLVALREKLGVPQVLGTDRHYSQGGVELENVRWDSASRTFSGTALGGQGASWQLAIYVPSGYGWIEDDPEHFHDYANYSSVFVESEVLRAQMNFSTTGRVNWSFRFKPSPRT